MPFSDNESKALQETAKTIRKYEPSIRQLGQFFGRIVGRPMEQIGGLAGDVFAITRIELATQYMKRVKRIMSEQGMKDPSRKVAISIVYPLFDAASLEEEDDIQEIFAQLLVNALNVDSGVSILKSFVSVVKSMSSLEMQILTKLVDAPDEFHNEGQTVVTSGLPEQYIAHVAGEQAPKPPEDITLALSNLVRSGCVNAAGTWGGGSTVRIVSVSPFGHALLKACRPPA